VTQGALPAYYGFGYPAYGAYWGRKKRDADAEPFYAAYGYAAVPFGSSTGLDPITQGLDPVTQGALPAFYGYGYPAYGAYWGRKKRDADAEPFYAAYGYTAPLTYAAVPFGSSTGLDPITQGLDPVTQGALPAYYGFGYPAYGAYWGRKKRDADAEPFYAAYGYAAVPFGSSTGLDPITQGLDPVTQGALPAYYGYGYPAYGAYWGRKKRDADAEPFYAAFGYTAVPFGSSTGLDPITQGLDPVTQGALPAYYGYPAYGAYWGRKKRDADAEPFYAAYGYAAVPFGSSTGLDPITQGLDASTQGFAPHFGYGYPYGYAAGVYLGK